MERQAASDQGLAGRAGEPEARGERAWIRRLLAALGPGLITGASDDDPSGIATYATAGASLGYATLWTAPFTFPISTASWRRRCCCSC